MSSRRRDFSGLAAFTDTLTKQRQQQQQMRQQRALQDRQFGQQRAIQDRQFTQQRALQSDRQAFEERVRKAIATEQTNRAVTVAGMRQQRPASAQDQLRQQQLGLAELQAPLPEGGFRQAELDNPAMRQTQVNPMLQRRQQALQDVGLVRPPAGMRPTDPLVQANRVGQLQQRVQQIEQANQLGGLAAEAERQKAATPGLFGTHIGRSVPPAVTMPQQDTSYLRSALQPYQGGGLTPSQPSAPSMGAGLPSDLPDPAQYQEGQVIENDQGQRMRLVRGAWVPL